MVVVTHEIRLAQQVADQVLFLDGGAVLASGPPGQVLAQPEHGRTRQFPRPASSTGSETPARIEARRATNTTTDVRTLAGVLRELAPTS